MEKKGFIISKIGKPLKYIAVSPTEVLERVKKSVLEEAEKERKKIESLKNTEIMEELLELHKTGINKVNPNEVSALLKGRRNIYNQLSLLFKEAKKNISIYTTEGGLRRKYEKFLKDFKEASERNVKIKIVAPLTNASQKVINDLSEFAQIKHSNTVSRFIIVDNAHLIFMLNDDQANPNYDIGIWVKSPFFVNSLNNMFNMSWKILPSKP